MMQYQEHATIIKEGPIEALALPLGWFEDEPANGPLPTSYKRRFHSFAAPTAELCIWYRGQPIDASSCENLMRLLSERSQILTKTKSSSIIKVLGNMGQEAVFKVLMIRTEAIAGRNVLSVEGRWSNGIDAYSLFMPEGPGSSHIIELHYQAPKDEFRKNLAAMKNSFSSIKWQLATKY